MTKIIILNGDNTEFTSYTRVISASFSENLKGECTLDFSVTCAMAAGITTDMLAVLELDTGKTYRFNIARISKAISSGVSICKLSCEQRSYALNEERYNITTEFDYKGSAEGCLARILNGTPLVAGVCEYSGEIVLKINKKCSRRAALMQLVALCRGEIEYSDNTINIRDRRGDTEYREIMNGKSVTDLTMDIDARSKTVTYGLKLFKNADFALGDNIHIVYKPFDVDIQTRIITLAYNPFNKREITFEVGDYFPSIDSSLYETEAVLDDMTDEFDELVERIEKLEEGVGGGSGEPNVVYALNGNHRFAVRDFATSGASNSYPNPVWTFDKKESFSDGSSYWRQLLAMCCGSDPDSVVNIVTGRNYFSIYNADNIDSNINGDAVGFKFTMSDSSPLEFTAGGAVGDSSYPYRKIMVSLSYSGGLTITAYKGIIYKTWKGVEYTRMWTATLGGSS